MIVRVRVLPNSKTESIQLTGEMSYKLKVKEKALEGRANHAVVNALASYFKVSKTDISIIRGIKSKNKMVEIAFPPF